MGEGVIDPGDAARQVAHDDGVVGFFGDQRQPLQVYRHAKGLALRAPAGPCQHEGAPSQADAGERARQTHQQRDTAVQLFFESRGAAGIQVKVAVAQKILAPVFNQAVTVGQLGCTQLTFTVPIPVIQQQTESVTIGCGGQGVSQLKVNGERHVAQGGFHKCLDREAHRHMAQQQTGPVGRQVWHGAR